MLVYVATEEDLTFFVSVITRDPLIYPKTMTERYESIASFSNMAANSLVAMVFPCYQYFALLSSVRC